MLLKGPNPIYTYFWAAELAEDKTIVPEFDLETGQEQLWGAVEDKKISRIMWYPFPEKLAHKVVDRICVAGSGPILEVVVPPGCIPLVHREHEISQYTYYLCSTCGTKIYWLPPGYEEPEGIPNMVVVPQTQPLECPVCGASNMWYCAQCKEIVDDPILSDSDPRLRFSFHLGEARCPKCEPTSHCGLNKIRNLDRMVGTSHIVRYALGWSEIKAEIQPWPRKELIRATRRDYLTMWDETGTKVED